MPRTQIRTGDIGNAEILNADIAASAAIASTKLANWSANRDANSNKLTNLADGTNPSDAVNFGQLSAVQAGFDYKEAARVASTQILDAETDISGSPTYTATAGASSRGQITATLAVSGTFSIDGIPLANNDRVLLKNEGDGGGLGGAANGLYFVTISGTSLTLDRTTDADADAEVSNGMFAPVGEGTSNGGSAWVLSTSDPVTIGGASGTALTFTKVNFILGGNGLLLTGNTLSLDRFEESFDISTTQTTVVLTNTPYADSGLEVYLNGLRLRQGGSNDWTRSGTTITFTFNLISGDIVLVNGYK